MDSRFTDAYLQATLMVSLLSVWVLVVLFYYLNRYTKRDYFTIWTASWLFYALWLTLSLTWPDDAPSSIAAMTKQCCVAISAAFLLWGTLRFLNIHVRQTLFGLFMLFLIVWTFLIPQVASNVLQIQLPVFILLGSGSAFAGVCFYRMRRKLPYVGAGMLAFGFLLWGVYLAIYPVARTYPSLHSIGYIAAAMLQLFIAVSMIVLVLEEVRHRNELISKELLEIRSEKDLLQAKLLSSEEEIRRMYDQVRLTEGVQKAYDELRRMQQAVVQQERLRALGQMASGVAHDINNALCPISAYSELLERSIELPSEQTTEYLQLIRSAANDISHIVARMREFYRQRGSDEELEPIAVNRSIMEIIELTRPRWKDLPQRQGVDIRVECELDANVPVIAGDPGELREALTNLLFNSVDALPSGGVITLRSRLCPGMPGDRTEATRSMVLVELQDNGIGMDKKTLERCMEPFFTTKAQRGTGLGLAMVYGMMQRHEGRMEITSEKGKGSCVRLYFPVPKQLPKQASITVMGGAQLVGSFNILCIDDEPGIRKLMVDCLGDFGHRVVTAEGGAEGLRLFQAASLGKQPFDVVITDLGMPQVDGNQVVRAVKAASPQTPVVMITGWGRMLGEEGAQVAEVDALVGKPPSMNDLNVLLHRLVSGRQSGGSKAMVA